VLKGAAFDRDCVSHVVDYMKAHGVTFLPNAVPVAFERQSGANAAVTVKYSVGNVSTEGEFDTVLIATGRFAPLADCGVIFFDRFCKSFCPHQIPLNQRPEPLTCRRVSFSFRTHLAALPHPPAPWLL
jgi:hypothetical protein